jgi:hypothetical protein
MGDQLMLYASIAMQNYPLGWEELEFKLNKLKQLNWAYQLDIGQRMFNLKYPEYQFTLIKWGHRPSINEPAKREVLYEGHDYYAVLGFISMLLKAEEELR